MKVEVYRNLRQNTFSIRENGLVTEWSDRVMIRDATLVVRPAGNRKVREEKRKNVHAFVRGQRIYGDVERLIPYMTKITYNPYEHTSFVNAETGEPVYEAGLVVLDIVEGVYCANEAKPA